MYGKCCEIKSDLYNVARRLKEIDKDYFVVFNYKKKRFEVHNRGQKGSTFCLHVPFERLDGRTVLLVLKSRRERAEAFFADMERHNQRLFKDEKYRLMQKAEKQMEDCLHDF